MSLRAALWVATAVSWPLCAVFGPDGVNMPIGAILATLGAFGCPVVLTVRWARRRLAARQVVRPEAVSAPDVAALQKRVEAIATVVRATFERGGLPVPEQLRPTASDDAPAAVRHLRPVGPDGKPATRGGARA